MRLHRWEWYGLAAAIALCGWCWFRLPTEEAQLLLNTLTLGLCAVAIALPIATLLAFLLTRYRMPWRRLWEGCLLALLFVPLYIQLASWEAGFGRGGWYSLRIAEQLSNPPLDGFRGAVWIHAMAAIPWLYWMLRLGLRQVPATLIEAASLDASTGQVFRHVIAPLALPSFVASGLYVMIITATEITATDRYQFRSYAEVLYNQFVLNTSFRELPLGVAPVITTLLVVSLGGLLLCRLLWPAFIQATTDRPRLPPRLSRKWASVTTATLVSMLCFLPLLNLLYQAGLEVRQVGADRVRSWSLAKLLSIVGSSPQVYAQELAWTAVLAQLSTIAAVTVACGLAYWGLRYRWIQISGTLLAIGCFVTPGPFIGLGLIGTLNSSRSPDWLSDLYADTLLAPWMAITIRCFPFAFLILSMSIRSIPRVYREAALLDGASAWQSWRFLLFPLLRPALFGASLVCLAVSVGELSASVLVLPAGVTTVSSRVFHLIHYGAEDELAGLCLACLGLMLLLAGATRAVLLRGPNIPQAA